MERLIYEYNANGLYIKSKPAKVNPRNPNKILVPNSATDLTIPQYSPDDEVLIFESSLPGIGDSSIAECSWHVMNKKNLILDAAGIYRHMTPEEIEEDNYNKLVNSFADQGILVYERIYKLDTFELGRNYIDITTSNVYTTDKVLTNKKMVFPDKNFINTNGDDTLIIVYEKGFISEEVKTFAFNVSDFEKYFNGNIQLLYNEFDIDKHGYVFANRNDYIKLTNLVVNGLYTVREATKDELRSASMIPPNDEPIWVKVDGSWVIDPSKITVRTSTILQDLYNLRVSRHTYFICEINGKKYNQRWTDPDKLYMELIIRDLTSGKFPTVNWRFNGADPDAVESLNLSDAYRMFNTGKLQELRCTCAQLLAATKIKAFIISEQTTDGIDYVTEFNNQLEFVNTISDTEIEYFYNAM